MTDTNPVETLEDIAEAAEAATENVLDEVAEPLAEVDEITSGAISELIGKVDSITSHLAAGDAHRIRLETKVDSLLGEIAQFPKVTVEQIEEIADDLEDDASKVVDDIEPTPAPVTTKKNRTLMKRRSG